MLKTRQVDLKLSVEVFYDEEFDRKSLNKNLWKP